MKTVTPNNHSAAKLNPASFLRTIIATEAASATQAGASGGAHGRRRKDGPKDSGRTKI